MKLSTAIEAVGRPARASSRALSFFEFWPSWLFYTPAVTHWVLLGLRHGAQFLPALANPHIEYGGFAGESKSSILDQVSGPARDLLARYAVMSTDPKEPRADLEVAMATMAQAGLNFPLVAKPDIGCNGTGVRLIQRQADLVRYFDEFPRGPRVLLQELIPNEGEAGLFYIREPGATEGRITSITLKHAPYVVGDGRTNLRELILADERAGRVPHLYLPRLQGRLDTVPAQGERVRLVFAGNHCKGSIFEDGGAYSSAAMTEAIDRLARALPDFHFGRIDVRYESIAALRRGTGFRVIEINGVTSEPTHIWDPETRLIDAWRSQIFHYGAAFRIGRANRARGFKPPSIPFMLRALHKQRRLLASYPMND
ncbi:MAG: D-alanine--D-alanine ligase [Acetobacteraceae bacterium]|nr:D-alanine--D-alanine ligase [Acetobacteraceae bacterium]